MTLTLLVVAMMAAANPARAVAARPAEAPRQTIAIGVGATLGLVLLFAFVSGPFLDLVDVSGPNARIAGGIALLVVALKDVFLAPPSPEPALAGRRGGLVPLAFPVIFSPAVALLAVAGASERGVGIAVLAAGLALAPVALALAVAPASHTRAATAAVGVFGAGIAALVVLDGVYAI